MSENIHLEQNVTSNDLSILKKIFLPYTMIISIIGICGNFLTIIVLSKRSIAKNFNNCTLIALALTDLLFNFMLIFRCITDFIGSYDENLCRSLSFLSHLAELLSACFTAQFTAQRFIAVRFPLSVSTKKRIHLIHYLLVSLFIIFGVCYCLLLVQNTPYDKCYEELGLKWFLSDALLSFLIPFTTIIILNILIVVHLKKGFQNNHQFCFIQRGQQTERSSSIRGNRSFTSHDYTTTNQYCLPKFNANTKGTSLQKHANDEAILINKRACSIGLLQRSSLRHSKTQSYRVTRMLILVSTCFLLLNAPFHMWFIALKMYIRDDKISIDSSHSPPIYSSDAFKQYNNTSSVIFDNLNSIPITQTALNQNDMTNNWQWAKMSIIILVITQHISYASYSINFFLYSFCGMKVRRELKRYIPMRCQRKAGSRSISMQNTL